MAIFRIVDPECQAQWDAWVLSRPPVVQELIKRLPPNRLYRLNSTGHRVFIYSYSEDQTVTVVVSGEYNTCMFERRVFGIKPEDLEECDLPAENEELGVALKNEDEIEEYIQSVKDSGIFKQESVS